MFKCLILLMLVCGQTGMVSAGSPTRFIDALEHRDWAAAERLFAASENAHAPVDQTQADGMTPLHWAVFHRNVDWTRRLLDAGADPNAKTVFDVPVLSIACQNGDLAIAKLLIDHRADLNVRLAGNETLLGWAARGGNAELCELLIGQGADVNAADRAGQTALMLAAAEGHADVIGVLIEAGAERDRQLASGFSALCFAVRGGHTEAAMALIDRGADVNQTMDPKRTSGRNARKGMTPLMLAVESAHYALAMKLIERGADPNDEASEFAPLHALSWVRRPQKGDNPEGDPPPRGSGNLSALDFVREIVATGADVNLKLRRGGGGQGRLSSRGATPFLMAAQTVDLPYMELLLQLGADPKLANADGCTALMAAAGVGNHFVGEHEGTPEEVERAVRMLVDLGLDINAVAGNGETAMHGAAYRCFPETVLLVATLGADVKTWNHKNKFGWSPLDIAQGYRPGSFKPDPATIRVVSDLLKKE